MSLGPLEIGLIVFAVLLLFGYKKLPDASRAFGRSLRIFKGEMKGMKDDDARAQDLRSKESAATATPVRGEVLPPVGATTTDATTDAGARLDAEAREAEARAAELWARAAAVRGEPTTTAG